MIETPDEHVALHMNHIESSILPGLSNAFRRGADKYRGHKHAWDGAEFEGRTTEEDIRHVSSCHVGVRLAEAEDLASQGRYSESLQKIESAIGYACALHLRITLNETVHSE